MHVMAGIPKKPAWSGVSAQVGWSVYWNISVQFFKPPMYIWTTCTGHLPRSISPVDRAVYARH